MRAGFAPRVLFPHLSIAGKETEFRSALSLEKSFAPVQHVGSPAKLQVSYAKQALQISRSAITS